MPRWDDCHPQVCPDADGWHRSVRQPADEEDEDGVLAPAAHILKLERYRKDDEPV